MELLEYVRLFHMSFKACLCRLLCDSSVCTVKDAILAEKVVGLLYGDRRGNLRFIECCHREYWETAEEEFRRVALWRSHGVTSAGQVSRGPHVQG